MQAKNLVLFGEAIRITAERELTNSIKITFDGLLKEQLALIKSDFYKIFSDLDDFYERVDSFSGDLRQKAVDLAMSLLSSNGVYELSEKDFFEKHMAQYDSWAECIEPVMESYEALLERTAALDAHRTHRRLNRDKWVGFNQQAVYTADAKNLMSNIGHGVFNLMAKGVTAIGNSIKKDQIFKSAGTREAVLEGATSLITAARSAVIDVLDGIAPKSVYLYSESEISKAEAIVENIKKGRVPGDAIRSSLLNALDAFPYNREIYSLFLINGGSDGGKLDQVASHFGFDDLAFEKERLFDAKRSGLDLSSLESLKANLPDLKAYAETIGYSKFLNEVPELYQAAAKIAFEKRVNSLSISSIEELRNSLPALKAYAQETGYKGATQSMKIFLEDLRSKLFLTEVAKHDVSNVTSLERNSSAIEAYAREIGYSDFEDWQKNTRETLIRAENEAKERKKPNAAKDSKDSKNKNSGWVRKIIIFILIVVLLPVAGLIFTGLFIYFEKSGSSSGLDLEMRTKTPEVRASKNNESENGVRQSIPVSPINPTQGKSRELSEAARKAISEGFVEIADPVVEACVEKKVAEYRKEAGADAIIGYQINNEFAVDCGFNI